MLSLRWASGLSALLASLACEGDATPDLMAEPVYGTIVLEAGFLPDPFSVGVRAGGATLTTDLGADCTGYINEAAPDVDLHYTPDGQPLFLHVESAADTTLVVHAPDGTWHCNDDGIGLDPVVAFERPEPGYYSVWIGTVQGGAARSLLRITEIDPREARSWSFDGSGFFVSAAGHFLTNAHVVEACGRLTVAGHGPARPVRIDRHDDLAMLRIDGYAGPFAVFAPAAVELGAALVLLGYPFADLLDGALNVTTGVVSGLGGLGGDRRYFQFSAPLQPGNSGGPVLDAGGRVIGVATAKLGELHTLRRAGSLPQNVNFALRNEVVMAFARRVPVDLTVLRKATTLTPSQISAKAARFTARVTCAE